MLSREEILLKNDRPIRIVTVPEWGGEVNIRKLSFADILRIQKASGGETAEALGELVALSVCDDAGHRIFADADIPELSQKNAQVLLRLASEIQEWCGLKESLEVSEKN